MKDVGFREIVDDIVRDEAKSIIRCYVTKQDSDVITQSDLQSVVFALLQENRKLQSRIDALEMKVR